MGKEADQYFNPVAPTRGGCLCIAVDSTARSYDIGSLAWGGKPFDEGNHFGDALFLTIQADGADVYFYFSSTASTSDLDETVATAVGVAATLDTKVPMKLLDGASPDVRIDRTAQRYIVLKVAAGTTGTPKFRIARSSQPSF